MSPLAPPEYLTPHYCGRCGCWHQGFACADQLAPPAPTTVIINHPTLSEDDVRRIVREELEAEAREVDHGLERVRKASRGAVCLDPYCLVCHPERGPK